jgi:hypothetical protein
MSSSLRRGAGGRVDGGVGAKADELAPAPRAEAAIVRPPAPARSPATETLLALQRTAGNAAVTAMLQRVPNPGAPRLPTPSAAAAVPVRVRGMQQVFHQRMREANEILDGTKFHYDYVNGIYAENFNIHEVIVGQAAAEAATNEAIRGFLVDAALTAAGLGIEAKAAAAALKVAEKARTAAMKAKPVAQHMKEHGEIMGAAGKIASYGGKAIGLMGMPKDAEGAGPADPKALRVVGLENVVRAIQHVNGFRDDGDALLDGSVDVTAALAAEAPDSGRLKPEDFEALNEIEAACEALLAEAERLLIEIRVLRDRRNVPIPSWHEVEQDIWLAYFTSKGYVPAGSNILLNHMVDFEMWGPPGQPGGRLQIDAYIDAFTRPPTVTLPGREDDEKKQSVQHVNVTRMGLIRSAAAQLPAKWARIMLLRG